MTLLQALWEYAPADWSRAIGKRVAGQYKPVPSWHEVRGGFAKGAKLFLDPDVFEGYEEMLEGRYDAFMFERLRQDLPQLDGATVWDVGGHFGYSALTFAAMVGERGQVVSFEPNPHNRKRFAMHLEKNAHLSQRVRIDERALTDRPGTLRFVFTEEVDGNRSSGSHLKAARPSLPQEVYADFQEMEVQAETADRLIENDGLPVPDAIKLDVEGAEYQALLGARRLLAEKHPLLLMEVHHILAMHDCLNLLHSLGYRTETLDRENARNSRCFIVAY